MAHPVGPNDFPAIRWHGHWIWLPEEPVEPSGFWSAGVRPQSPETHGHFRKTFHLDQVPSRVPARITADSRYLLFVNGEPVGRGPIRSQPRRMHYDLYDLAPYLHTGENLIAVYVRYYGAANSYWMPPVPNNTLGTTGILVFEADLTKVWDEAQGQEGWLVSDDSWRAHKTDAYNEGGDDPHHHGVPVDLFDARHSDSRWIEPDYDDSAWGAAQPVPACHIGGFRRTQPPTDPYGPLYPRPIAQLGGELRRPASSLLETLSGAMDSVSTRPMARVRAALDLSVDASRAATFPIEFDLSTDGAVRLSVDMGRIVSGQVEFDIDAPAGTVLDFSFTEDPLQASFTMDRMAAGMRYTARGKDDRFQLFDSQGLRYIYILVHSVKGQVILRDLGVRELLYPWQQGATFSCSDEELNRIWQAGVRTVELNSHDAFIDCPTREQRAWVGDGVVHQMVHLATNCDWRLAVHFCTLGNSPRYDGILPMTVAGDIEMSGIYTIPDWSLHWVHGVYNLYRFLGDRDAMQAFLPTIERILRWYAPYQTAQGVLKDVPEWNLVDWSSVSTEDEAATLTALWARGLREYAELAGWLDNDGSRRWADDLYKRALAGFERFWDAERGSYVDHIVDGHKRPEMSQLAGALGIVSGLAPRERWTQIVETITDPERLVMRAWTGDNQGGQSMEKWMAQVREGRYDIDWDVESQIVLAQPFMSYVVHDAVALAGRAARLPDLYRRWSQFLVDGYDTLGECWDYGTHVHGWACTPTRDMVFYTLGVTPAEPGYAVARVAPRLGGLVWARGSVPTPHGLIHVEARPDGVTIESPVPVHLALEGQPERTLEAGRHVV